MKKKRIKKSQILIISALFLLVAAVWSFFFLSKYFLLKNSNLKNIGSVDRPNYYRPDGAIPYYNLKWLENIKFDGKGLLTKANLQTTNEGKITRLSFEHGEINVDKERNVNYPYVVRIELHNPAANNNETLFFSQMRYNIAQIYRIDKNGLSKKTDWNDVKVGDYAKVEESIDLMVANTDSQINFTDKYVKSLTIYLQ